MKGRDRNSLCWCGSGKKLKQCHLDRQTQPKDNPWDAVNINRKAFSKKKCYASGVGLGDCKGGVIKAHTVSRGPNLSKISKNGHVLKFDANIPELNKNGGELSINKVGISDASVFYGFCSEHDRNLFSCLENEIFVGRPDQCLATAYRTMSRELYGKDAASHLRETLRNADKGRNLFEQFMLQNILNDMDIGNSAARRDLNAIHDTLTKALVNSQPEVLNSIIFEFASPLPFMFAGAWSPFTDFYDEYLQNGLSKEILEQVIFSSFSGSPGSIICVSWRNIDDAPGMVIAQQLMRLSDEHLASACLQFIMKHIENVFFNPDWFEALSEDSKNHLKQLATYGIDPTGAAPNTPIRLDLDFGLPLSVKRFSVQP